MRVKTSAGRSRQRSLFRIVSLLLALTNVTTMNACAKRTPPDVTVADFDGDTYPAGWTTEGTAFGSGPAHGALPNQMDVSGFEGRGLVDSYAGGDGSAGTLTSPAFPITRSYLSMLIGGGRHPKEERIDLIVDGQVVRSATGPNSEHLLPMQWNVLQYKGKMAMIKITDEATGGWGHINVDSITLTDTKAEDERTAALKAAMAAVIAAVPAAQQDSARPVYHFHAPAQWMNDINGPIYSGGWYHIFYQHHPYSAHWDTMHWGHARSKDMVNWEHLPIAIWPSKLEGEDHVYSGSVYPRADGLPMAFYTSIGSRDPEQWAALPLKRDLLEWRKFPGNPVVSQANHGKDHIAEWRDPFLFEYDHVTYMLVGGGLNGHGIVALYRAENAELTSWKYLGPIFHHPDAGLQNIECPNIAHIDGKWVLLTSTYGKVEAFVGQLDIKTMTFTTEKRSVLGDGSYASQLMHDEHGQVIHFAWVNTDRKAAWNGYLTMASTLRIAKDGTLIRQPVAAFEKLRGERVQISGKSVSGMETLAPGIHGDSCEIVAEIDPSTARSIDLKLRVSPDGTRSISIHYEAATRTLSLQGKPAIAVPGDGPLKLRVFVDHGSIDVYTHDGTVTECGFFADAQPGDTGIQLAADGGAATITTMEIYAMKPAAFDMSHFH